MPKIYHTPEGWRIKGFTGTMATEEKAQARLARERRNYRGLGFLKPSYKSIKAYEQRAGSIDAMAGKVMDFSVFKELGKSMRAFFRKDEPRREAIVRAKQQRKLNKYF